MSNTLELLKQEEKEFKDTLVLNMFDLAIFRWLREDEYDYYYVYEDIEKEKEEVSACAGLIYLKELLKEQDYKVLLKSFLLKQKEFLNQPILNKSECLNKEEFSSFSLDKEKIPFIQSLCFYGAELFYCKGIVFNKDIAFVTLEDLEGEEKIIKLKRIIGARYSEENLLIQIEEEPLIFFKEEFKDYGRLLYWWKLNSRAKEFVIERKEPFIEVKGDKLRVEWYIEDEILEQVAFNIEYIYLKENEINEIEFDVVFYKENDESYTNDLEIQKKFFNELKLKNPIPIKIKMNNGWVKIKN